MNAKPQLAFTADLHWGHHQRGDDAVRGMVAFLEAQTPDVLILAGDIGTGSLFGECLRLFAGLPCRKALVPGNHDIWVHHDAEEPDSLHLYREQLPLVAAQYGFEYLDHRPLALPEAGLALVGSINWYDYSWAIESIRRDYPAEMYRLESKRFTRGRHNDANFVRWPLDDLAFTAQVVGQFERQLLAALETSPHAIAVTHHPSFPGISFPRGDGPHFLDEMLWDAFGGNRRLQELLERHAERVPFAFCGHTHRAREGKLGPIRGYNIGGDYHFKRLLWLDWAERKIEAHQFGNPDQW